MENLCLPQFNVEESLGFLKWLCEKCNISCVVAFSIMVTYVKRQVVDSRCESRLVSYMR